MASVPLNQQQEELRRVVEEQFNRIRGWSINDDISPDERQQAFQVMGDAAHQLHISITPEPRHFRHIIENRGMDANHPQFYYQIHCVEDLLDYIRDTDSNRDPEDQTIGDRFEFNVYSRRWGHEDHYGLTRTSSGWNLSHTTYGGEMNKSCEPNLFEALRHESVIYPRNLSGFFEWLWDRAERDGLSHDEVQEALNQLANWVSNCERDAPRGVFQGYI
ncbi:hypothetical protein ACPV3A_14335 [Paenibacillus sp. Dod16]|uniref:hypothetical protein n=1 Tax=Paenibacillus sp. Dod16 TaxID=3416392 RepID=UPI003CF4B5ED